MQELLKKDSDNIFHYNYEEIMQGEVVLPSSDEALSYGYFGTTQTYPNPFLIKLTRTVWKQHPNFLFFSQSNWGRNKIVIQSGMIPFANDLRSTLTKMINMGENFSTKILYDWFIEERSHYPQNSLLIYPSSSQHFPSPTAQFGYKA